MKPTKEAEQLSSEVEIILRDSQAVVVLDQKDYDEVNVRLKNIKLKYKALEDERRKATIPLDDAKKVIMDWFRKPLEALQLAESKIKSAILVFYRNEEEKRLVEEKRLRDLADREAERLRKRAEKLEAEGKTEKAEEIREQVEVKQSITPVVEKTFEKAKGVSTKTIWKFRVIDKEIIPRQFLMVDEKKIGDIAEATKGTFELPGVQFYSEQILAVRTR